MGSAAPRPFVASLYLFGKLGVAAAIFASRPAEPVFIREERDEQSPCWPSQVGDSCQPTVLGGKVGGCFAKVAREGARVPTIQFKGKSVIETYHHTVPHHRLEFVPKLSVLPKGEKPGLDGNLIIEGDNLAALKSLLPTHAGKVKCIYIDPPYNTGEEGWVYNDKLTQPQFKEWIGQTVGKEGDDATRHDKWCCMMYPRLVLLRELLRDDGALFVSIDDNEAGALRLILDEIFHVEMPLATFVWKRRSATGMRGDPVSVDHEYVYLYAKDRNRVTLTGLVRTAADYPLEDAGGRYASTDLTIGMTEEDRPNQAFSIRNPRTSKQYHHNPDRVWRFEPETMKKVIADDLVIWPDENPGEMERPRFKTYFDPNNPKIKPVSSWIETTKAKTRDEDDDDLQTIASGLNSEGGRALKRILGAKLFDYPKPPSLIRSLVRLATAADDIVLDSFAGSGTTGQAVLDENAADGAARRFVLIQLPHDSKEQEAKGFNVCETVTAARMRNLIGGYVSTNGKRSNTLTGLVVNLPTPAWTNHCSASTAILARTCRPTKSWPSTFSTPRRAAISI